MTSRLLIGLVGAALAAFLVGLSFQHVPARLWRHALFAVGVMPLILGAMLYFVPVLTRSSAARGGVLLVPVGALLVGAGAAVAFLVNAAWLPGLALSAAVLVVLELIWLRRRGRATLGPVHPGFHWYQLALVALLLGLLSIGATGLWPDQWAVARAFHLHLNLLGFLGLTAIGTLRVLIPTALGTADASAHRYLRSQAPLAFGAALGVAVGAAFLPPLSILGGLLWLLPGLWLLVDLQRLNARSLQAHHAIIALSAAAWGWLAVLLAGLAHGLDLLAADQVMALLVYLFLLPLVTGATSYLLPVWRWPGKVEERHHALRRVLMRQSGLRVVLFWSSGVLALFELSWAALPAMLALLAYALQVLAGFIRMRPARA